MLLRDSGRGALATIAFALGQAVAACGFSLLFARTDDAYPAMFALGGGALLVAWAIDLLARTAPMTLQQEPAAVHAIPPRAVARLVSS
jgi:hypothetical protein